MICTFFGHKDAPETIRPLLSQAIRQLMDSKEKITFYVGNNGNFDRMAISELKKLSADFFVVLAYLPETGEPQADHPTLFPEGLENVPKRFAVDRRNKWLADRSDIVITYVVRSFGGAAKFAEYARKHKKDIVNIAEL